MANPESTSFIPQRPTKGKVGARRVRKLYVLTYISYILFFGAILSAGVVFFFSYTMQAQLEDQKQQLAAERDRFNQADIESVRELEKKMSAARKRLDNHVSVLAIFEALEKSTLASIRFVSFSYERFNDEFPLLTFAGTAGSFNSVLFQREVLAANPILKGSTFKEVESHAPVSETGVVGQQSITFTIEKEVDTSLIGYTPRGSATSQAPQQEQGAPSTEQTDQVATTTETVSGGNSASDEAAPSDQTATSSNQTQ